MKKQIYLGSSIQEDEEVNNWREVCTKYCRSKLEFHDPTAYCQDGYNARDVIEHNLKLLRKCDLIVVNLTKEDVSTGIELAYARMYGLSIHVIIPDPEKIIDNYLLCFSDAIHESLEKFLESVKHIPY